MVSERGSCRSGALTQEYPSKNRFFCSLNKHRKASSEASIRDVQRLLLVSLHFPPPPRHHRRDRNATRHVKVVFFEHFVRVASWGEVRRVVFADQRLEVRWGTSMIPARMKLRRWESLPASSPMALAGSSAPIVMSLTPSASTPRESASFVSIIIAATNTTQHPHHPPHTQGAQCRG